MINIISIVFYQFAALLLIASTMVVVSKNPVKSVLSLVLAFFASAVLWMLQQAEFLALALIFVYVGAVMTLFLFIVLMLNVSTLPKRQKMGRFFPMMLAFIALFGYSFFKLFNDSTLGYTLTTYHPVTHSMLGSAENIAALLYTDYILAFELVAVVLLIAIVAAIGLTYRGDRTGMRRQKIGKQVLANPRERVELIKMEAESS